MATIFEGLSVLSPTTPPRTNLFTLMCHPLGFMYATVASNKCHTSATKSNEIKVQTTYKRKKKDLGSRMATIGSKQKNTLWITR